MSDALLNALLRKVSAGGAPEGLYEALRLRREFVPGHDQTSTTSMRPRVLSLGGGDTARRHANVDAYGQTRLPL